MGTAKVVLAANAPSTACVPMPALLHVEHAYVNAHTGNQNYTVCMIIPSVHAQKRGNSLAYTQTSAYVSSQAPHIIQYTYGSKRVPQCAGAFARPHAGAQTRGHAHAH
eukprot:886258-Pleurochrysis_carterae.AAC.1